MCLREVEAFMYICFSLRAAGGAASEGAVSSPSEAGGPGKRPAAAAGGAGISGAQGLPGLTSDPQQLPTGLAFKTGFKDTSSVSSIIYWCIP